MDNKQFEIPSNIGAIFRMGEKFYRSEGNDVFLTFGSEEKYSLEQLNKLQDENDYVIIHFMANMERFYHDDTPQFSVIACDLSNEW